jgi:hypothetical protein
MRSIREIFEQKDKGLFICQYPRCMGYGNTADRRYGVVCGDHKEILDELDKAKVPEPVAR